MRRSEIRFVPEEYEQYIGLIDDVDLAQAFQESLRLITAIDHDRLRKLGDRTYASGKWTVKCILQHVNDIERIHCYRTLLFARSSGLIPQSFDSEALADHSKADVRNIEALLGEMKAIRLATIAMFESFDDGALTSTGINWKYEMSVLAMGFLIIGHQKHHLQIIEEKYFPLLTHP